MMVFHCLFACIVSNKKSVVIPIFVPLYIISSSHTSFKCLSLPLALNKFIEINHMIPFFPKLYILFLYYCMDSLNFNAVRDVEMTKFQFFIFKDEKIQSKSLYVLIQLINVRKTCRETNL